jgi:acyl-CoA thioester hydrolase
MYTFETPIRIHYALTDQMGVVYHGHYAQFYEIGRTEAIRNLGYTYKDVEAMGIIMPVVDLHMKYLLPARYDDVIRVIITIREITENHKMIFHGEIRIGDKLINTGTATLYMIDAKTRQKVGLPQQLKDRLLPYFNQQD